MTELRSQWSQNETAREKAAGGPNMKSHPPAGTGRHPPQSVAHRVQSVESGGGVWFNAELHHREATTRLDDQDPATLFYLGRVIKLDGVVQVYVDQMPNGEIKHWTVIESRDFDLMDEIYDIELDTRDKFPYANLNFRVTTYTDDGPSAAHHSMKIYDTA